MVKYKKLKLVAFYLMMAWASLRNSKDGQDMIDAAQAGKGAEPIEW